MILIREMPFPMDAALSCPLSCLIEKGGTMLGVDSHRGMLCSWDGGGALTQTALAKNYGKLSYAHVRQCYFAISRCAPGSAFLLDSCFQELDRIGIRTERPNACAEDIWFDADSDLLWLVFPEAVYRFNTAGDCLGAFMTAPQGTQYRALCTNGELLFLAYQQSGCTYVSSYNQAGAHLERVSLGGEYTVCNLQAIERDGGSCLRVFAHKGLRFPFTLEIELTAPCPTSTLSVECFSDTPKLCSTCHIDSPSGQ